MFEIATVERMAPGPELAQVLLSADVATLDADQAATWAAASERLEAHLEARRYDAVARFADLSPYEPPPPPIVEGVDRPVQPGGDGTPEVSEFAAIGLGCALHSSTERAHGLIGQAIDLRHRHTQMFARLRAGEVPAFKVRMVLRASHSLSLLAARALDARIAARVARMGPKKLADEIDATLIAVDSAEAERRAASARRTRHVGVTHSSDGERRLYGWVGAFDGLAFDAAPQQGRRHAARPRRRRHQGDVAGGRGGLARQPGGHPCPGRTTSCLAGRLAGR